MLVVRQFPSAWRTGRALRFREFQAKDLCPQPKGPPYKDQPGWNKDTLRQFEEGALLLKHKHVQMSLKYDRLEKKTHQQKSFLKTLLEPYHTDFSPGLEMHPLDKCGAVGHFESHPKLVSGRYLLFNQWTFTNPWKDGTIVLGELGRFGACEHQRMTGIPDGFSEPKTPRPLFSSFPRFNIPFSFLSCGVTAKYSRHAYEKAQTTDRFHPQMPRHNRAEDLDFEIHVDPSCLSDPMDDNDTRAPEEPKVEVETDHDSKNDSAKELDNDIETTNHTDLPTEAKAEPTVEAKEERKEEDQSTITPKETKEEAQSDQEASDSEADSEVESEPEAEPKEEAKAQVDTEDKPEEPIEEPATESEEVEAVPATSEAEADTTATEPSLDDTKDNDEDPTPVEDVTTTEDTPADTPTEDTPSIDIPTDNIPAEDSTAQEPKKDEPIEEDKAKSAEAEVETSAEGNEERHFSETESDRSGSRRESSGSSGSEYSSRRHSGRSEAINGVARDIASQIDNHEKRESLNSYSGTDDTGYISHSESVSTRTGPKMSTAGMRGGVDEAAENSSHHEHEDDVFSDRSPRSSMGSVSETDNRKAQDAMSRMTRSPRVSGVSGISGFSEYDREEEDFILFPRFNIPFSFLSCGVTAKYSRHAYEKAQTTDRFHPQMPRHNRAEDLDFEIHVDPSCLSDPMDDNDTRAPEEPKVEVETDHDSKNDSAKELDNDIETTNHTDLPTEAKAEPTVEAKEEPTEPSLDDTKDNDEDPTPVEDVTTTEDTPADTPTEDTPSIDIPTDNIPAEDSTAQEPKKDEPIEEDKAKSAEAEVETSAEGNEERHFSETESDRSGSRRESSGSSGSEYSSRRHSGRSEAINGVARDIASQIDNHEKRESLNSYSGTDDTGYISHSESVSTRTGPKMSTAGMRGGVDEAAENSSHHEHEDDVFSDRSPRSSMGSVSETDNRKAQDAMSRMTRSPRVSGVSGISGFSEYDREEEDFIPTIRGNPRPVFRSPSSVKAMQMSSPPGSTIGSPRSSRRAPLSASRLGSPRFSEQYSPKKTPPRFKRSTPPLVLLHVTLLPLRWPWGDVLENADADDLSKECKAIRDAWRLLQDRMADTTVERGILLPHPQSDYEVLEERLLEALDLPMRRRARILECGHYLGPSNEMTIEDSEEEESEEDEYQQQEEEERRSSRRSQVPPTHWCKTCKSDINYESLGRAKVFRVKVYASNGLIRGGAWEACWKEMERVDVEIEPLVDAVSQHELVSLEADQERELAMREAEEEERYIRLDEEHREFEERERGRLSRRRGESRNHVEDMSHVSEGKSRMENHDTSQAREASVHDTTKDHDQSHLANDTQPAEEHSADVTKESIKELTDNVEESFAEDQDAERSRSFEELEKDIDDHLQEERERSLAEEARSAEPTPEPSHLENTNLEAEESSIAPEDPADSKDDEAERLRRDEESATLPELLAESARVAMQDKKNILIGLLSVLILLLAIRGNTVPQQEPRNFQTVVMNREVPTVTVTQAISIQATEAAPQIAASADPVVEEERNVEAYHPEESIVVEDTTAENHIVQDEQLNNNQIAIGSSYPSHDGSSTGSVDPEKQPTCEERIVRIVETVTAVETATVKITEYATDVPSQETQAAEAVEESVAPEAEDTILAAEAPVDGEASVEETLPTEETVLPSDEAESVKEEEDPAQETVSPDEEHLNEVEQEAEDAEPSIEVEATSESAAPEALGSDEETPEQAAEHSEEADEL
ncbi:hypothetical protein FOC4_g10007378 [Fusarium odoratissimum]|uniref:Pathway-specific nitrogen regulator n=1 Tax=Fusarium oxysporum f. sp. cubense (strain race 4) TaxID=2502994 RepID=N1RGS0_FUSC4|nr:hypothetical protein FOC4_g10007378 [Fusarium odoratissimum]